MSGLSTWFGWQVARPSDELPEIFPIQMIASEFIQTDIINIYTKILTDVCERIQGLSDDQKPLLWDNCLKSEAADGLITTLAKAMSEKKDLFLVYEAGVKVVRKATVEEERVIKSDYEKRGESSVGIFISFKNYVRSDMIKLYSGMEYSTVSALNKSMNLSKAIQLKMNDLRASVSLADSAEAKTQAQAIAKGLAAGKDILLDAKDMIETSKPDLTAVEAAVKFLNQKRSFYLGMPEAYISGEQTGGLGTTGENDTKAIERGLKNYFFSIIKPVLEALFKVTLKYKSQDFRQITQALEAIKTFTLVGEDILSADMKKIIVEQLLDIDPKENKTTESVPVAIPADAATGTKNAPGVKP